MLKFTILANLLSLVVIGILGFFSMRLFYRSVTQYGDRSNESSIKDLNKKE